MKLEFDNKSLEYLKGEPHKTRVLLTNEEGAMYPVYFPPDFIGKTNSELLELSLEKIYQENFPGRSEKEKFDFLDKTIAEHQKETEKIREMVKTVSLSFTQFVELLEKNGLVSDEDDEEVEEEVVEDEATDKNKE
ncbi:DUF1366 domain-containing protein [Streptococcus ruminantium]|uniref:DUF1366 domain-containing protein n=1 Tax=Streptococcus ruminantium TaxID=1917441 RepID=UPI0012DC177C|nr:DUF1366 domain-containing protein [Streptococcus ruminantium]BDD37946.1 hypothetical protein GUT183_01840 [Streptococcus ruminantium]